MLNFVDVEFEIVTFSPPVLLRNFVEMISSIDKKSVNVKTHLPRIQITIDRIKLLSVWAQPLKSELALLFSHKMWLYTIIINAVVHSVYFTLWL